MVHIAYRDAEAYAHWAGNELPTDAEWEFAARGGLTGAEFAWGDEPTPQKRHTANTWQGESPLAVIRTSLSLIGFGFTIFQFFNKLKEAGVLKGAAPARNFGTSLVVVGTGMLILGISYHVAFMLGLRRERNALKGTGPRSCRERLPEITSAHRRRDAAAHRCGRGHQHGG